MNRDEYIKTALQRLAQIAGESINTTPEEFEPTLHLFIQGKQGDETGKVRLTGPESPQGEIVEENTGGVKAIFNAIDVLAWCVAHGAKVDVFGPDGEKLA